MITKYECSTSSTKISISTQNNYKESYTDQHHTSVVDGIRQSINKKLFQELFWDFFSSSMSIWIPRNQQGRKPSIISWIILGSLHRHCLSKFPEIKKYKKSINYFMNYFEICAFSMSIWILRNQQAWKPSINHK